MDFYFFLNNAIIQIKQCTYSHPGSDFLYKSQCSLSLCGGGQFMKLMKELQVACAIKTGS